MLQFCSYDAIYFNILSFSNTIINATTIYDRFNSSNIFEDVSFNDFLYINLYITTDI